MSSEYYETYTLNARYGSTDTSKSEVTLLVDWYRESAVAKTVTYDKDAYAFVAVRRNITILNQMDIAGLGVGVDVWITYYTDVLNPNVIYDKVFATVSSYISRSYGSVSANLSASNAGHLTPDSSWVYVLVPKEITAKGFTVTAELSDDAGFASAGSSVNRYLPALPQYLVKYSASNASNVPAQQTKYHGKTLTLSSTVPTLNPTLSGRRFRWWEYSATGVVYAHVNPGASWTRNETVTLYAEWYWTPSVTINSVTRCNQAGTATEGGAYYKANVTLFIDDELKSGSTKLVLKVGNATTTLVPGTDFNWTDIGTSEEHWAKAVNITLGPFNANMVPSTSYSVAATLTDSAGYSSTASKTTTTSYTAPSLLDVSVERSTQGGSAYDEGRYAHLTGTWNVANIKDANAVQVTKPSRIQVQSLGGVNITLTDFSDGGISGNKRTAAFSIIVDSSMSQGPYDTDSSYDITVTLTDVFGNASHVIVTLPPAFYTMDALGDKYFDSHGYRPGHGISFGAPATHEGFNMSMKPYHYNRESCPVFYYAVQPAEADVPCKPCIVVVTGTGKSYLYY